VLAPIRAQSLPKPITGSLVVICFWWGKIQHSLDPRCRKTSDPQAVTNLATSKLKTTRWASWRHTQALGDRCAFHAAQPQLDAGHGDEVEA
jgi:hypothetical protein